VSSKEEQVEKRVPVGENLPYSNCTHPDLTSGVFTMRSNTYPESFRLHLPATFLLLGLILTASLVSCKPRRPDAGSDLRSNIAESAPVRYVVLSEDSGRALTQTVEAIKAKIPAAIEIIYLRPGTNRTVRKQDNVITLLGLHRTGITDFSSDHRAP
jgi:hypothetical protein